jgi:hypothetical protein
VQLGYLSNIPVDDAHIFPVCTGTRLADHTACPVGGAN